MAEPLRFIRKNGHIIPIRAPGGAGKVIRAAKVAKAGKRAGVAAPFAAGIKKQDVKPNRALQASGFGIAVASGVLGAATFFRGTKGLVGGTIAGLGLDVASTASTVGAYAGKGKLKQRAKAATRQEAINTVVGEGVFIGGLLAQKKGREYAARGAGKALGAAKTLLTLARRKIVGA